MRDDLPGSDPHEPLAARIWTYWLGGTEHFPVDRRAADRFARTFPDIVELARVGRYFLGRVVRFLTVEAGVRQFLDIGPGLPTAGSTHLVAQRLTPGARVLYADNDPAVLAHARALLDEPGEGATHYVAADLRRPETILDAASATLDLDRPVGLLLMGVLAYVPEYEEARSLVKTLLDGLPQGSYLALRDGVDTHPGYVRAMHHHNAVAATPYHLRTPEQLAGYLDGLELVEPGVVPCPQWRPDPAPWPRPEVALLGAVGRKP
ncbi:SAM-dependent methyltransferase [Streptomyces hoynatensis]|uniref:SAM-dependent methyltransferase n=1 Tax=Streptomyces hoynatensis TaxID=1141874 RepID=A0A3A9ZF63_9ACTN|nr:SAM-dependent methyltransferase [Streptomyces hoynatensis]RKN45897.1 SAM-dependent methyltransferase [Streptomyces hoynatensis]